MRLSIITPVYNREDCILRCLESVSAQSAVGGFEHVVVDDGSDDRSKEIVAEFAASHPYVKTLFFDRNRGTNAARNLAIQSACGEYCVFLDSDDYLLPGALDAIMKLISQKSDYRYFMLTIDYRQKDFDSRYGYGATVEYRYEDVLSGKMSGDYVHVMPRDVMIKYPFDESLRIYESLILMQYYREVGKMLFLNVPAVAVELHRADSVTLDTVRISDGAIKRKLLASLKELELFGSDYEKNNLNEKLEAIYGRIVEDSLLLGDYATAGKYLGFLKGSKRIILSSITSLHLAPLLKKVLQLYLKKKYSYSNIVKS